MTSSSEDIKKLVKQKYGSIINSEGCCSGGCSSDNLLNLGKTLGYNIEDAAFGAGEANLGLGCGNPLHLADLKPDEFILDLGCGAGFDVFLAAKRVGDRGQVIGIDMTPEMLEKAKENAKKWNFKNVEFKLGDIDNIPVTNNWADLVISNCVINLAPDKSKVFNEIFRVLKPGGRISISDILRNGELPEKIKNDPVAYTA